MQPLQKQFTVCVLTHMMHTELPHLQRWVMLQENSPNTCNKNCIRLLFVSEDFPILLEGFAITLENPPKTGLPWSPKSRGKLDFSQGQGKVKEFVSGQGISTILFLIL